MSTVKIPTGLCLDEITYGKLQTLALQEDRSLTDLIEQIIRLYLTDYEIENGVLSAYSSGQSSR